MSSPEQSASSAPETQAASPKGLARHWLLGILALSFLFVLMPFLFWRATWFGLPLSDEEITRNLADGGHPRKVQHGLSQIADRILSPDPGVRASARRWYPAVTAVAMNPHAELRLTAAWVMGQDNSSAAFHDALRSLLADINPMVRRNAALSLVRFQDSAGHDEIRAILEPYAVKAGAEGTLRQRLVPGDTLNPGTLLGRIEAAGQKIEVRSEVPGSMGRWLVADGSPVLRDTPIAAIDPSAEEQWEALKALALIGQPEDLAVVESLARSRGELPDTIRKAAEQAARGIRQRSGNL